jgi:hypothetical protein
MVLSKKVMKEKKATLVVVTHLALIRERDNFPTINQKKKGSLPGKSSYPGKKQA